jgi:hypothetical protein
MKMKRFVPVLTLILLLSAAGFSAWSSLTKVPASVSSIDDRTAIVVDNPTQDLGTVSTDISKGYAGDEVTMTVRPMDATTDEVKSLFLNNQEIALNATGVYRFTLGEETVVIHATFQKKTVAENVTDLQIMDLNPCEGTVSFFVDGKNVCDATSLLTSQSCAVKAIPLPGYAVSSFSLNGTLQILPDENDAYSFLLHLNNQVRATFAVVADADMNSFTASYPKDPSATDFIQEIASGKLNIALFSYVVMKKLTQEPVVVMKAANTAISTAFWIANKQATHSTWIRKNDSYFKENITYSGAVEMAERVYLQGKDVDYYRVTGSAIADATTADYTKATDQKMSYAAYHAMYFYNPEFPLAYDFRKENILPTSYLSKTESGYRLTMNMSLDSLSDYRHYMITTTRDAKELAQQSDLPSFSSVTLTFSLGSNLQVQNGTAEEAYKVKSKTIGDVPTTASSTITFTYPETVSIPAITETLPY